MALAGLLSAFAAAGCAPPDARPVTVFAAASLSDALIEIAQDYEDQSGVPVRLSFGASGALARQIEAGAPADVVILADRDWMARLSASGHLDGSPEGLLGNRLVLIAPTRAAVGSDPLATLAPGDRLAIGDPDSVPAGTYARAWLQSTGRWQAVQDRLVFGADVRAVRAFVARREAVLGVVYRSDTIGQTDIRPVLEPPADQQPEIVYPVAAVKNADRRAGPFIAHLKGATAAAVFRRRGFDPLV